MLERVWRKGNPLTLLVEMQTSTATMENSVEIPLKTAQNLRVNSWVVTATPKTLPSLAQNKLMSWVVSHSVGTCLRH